MEDPTFFLFIGGSLVLQQTLPEFSGVKLLRWVLMDPDDVIRKLLAFGALFRTQATLFTLKRNVLGAFSVNNDCGVR
ncbi:hypothetical protein NST48_10680 [Paenibacillus sp. FSL M7-0547]|uniref:hypothetical protein n=1 Tax=Paenibacillus sp. FSL M7-0547 TaxID=2954755 RepID=UPI0030FB354F